MSADPGEKVALDGLDDNDLAVLEEALWNLSCHTDEIAADLDSEDRSNDAKAVRFVTARSDRLRRQVHGLRAQSGSIVTPDA